MIVVLFINFLSFNYFLFAVMDLNDIKYFLLNTPKNVLPTDKFFFWNIYRKANQRYTCREYKALSGSNLNHTGR